MGRCNLNLTDARASGDTSHQVCRARGRTATLKFALAALSCLMLCGCSGDDTENVPAPTPAQPAIAQSAAPPPEPSPLVPASADWSLEQALESLASEDPDSRLSAAVRLVRLAELEALCLPPEASAAWLRRLRVVALGEERWALGVAAPGGETILRAPVLIDAEGGVALPVSGFEEELALLWCPRDSDPLPPLIILPTRILVVDQEIEPAIIAKSLPSLRFDIARNSRLPKLVLRLTHTPAPQPSTAQPPAGDAKPPVAETPAAPDKAVMPAPGQIVAEYSWDFYERMFAGPQADTLPDPPGGRFELDLAASPLLLPIGGETPEALPADQPPIPAPPPQQPRPDAPPPPPY